MLDVTEGEPTIGTANGVLQDIPYPTIMDHVSSFTISVNQAPLAVNQEELLADESKNRIFVSAGDDWEIVQFMNVTDNGDGSYTLSGFYRGLRSTEHLVSGHSGSDLVVFDGPGYVRAGDLSHLQIPSKFAALRTEDDDPPLVDFTPQLRSLRPYSPIDLNIEKPLDDNIITWTRRTRIGGASLDGSDVPISETSEEYEIDILDQSQTVVATKTGITTNSFTYTIAGQITDLGNENTPYTARVFQMSAEVGRGEAGRFSLRTLQSIHWYSNYHSLQQILFPTRV